MKLSEMNILFESKNLTINKLKSLVSSSKNPVYIVVAGSTGSGKTFIVNKELSGIDVVDPDIFTVGLGDGVYYEKNVAKSMVMVRKAVDDRLDKKQSFLQQGTSANLQSTINKLKKAKEKGFLTILLYIDAPIDQSLKQVFKRVEGGGHGASIDKKKVENTSAGSQLTFRALSGVDFDKATKKDLERVEKALEKTEKNLIDARKNLDYFIRIENKY